MRNNPVGRRVLAAKSFPRSLACGWPSCRERRSSDLTRFKEPRWQRLDLARARIGLPRLPPSRRQPESSWVHLPGISERLASRRGAMATAATPTQAGAIIISHPSKPERAGRPYRRTAPRPAWVSRFEHRALNVRHDFLANSGFARAGLTANQPGKLPRGYFCTGPQPV